MRDSPPPRYDLLVARAYSTATIEVKPDATTSVNVYGEGGINVGSDPRLAPTQFKIIQEQEILYPVIDQLGLDEVRRGKR